MKMKYWLIFSVSSLIFVGCVGEAAKQPIENPAPTATTFVQSTPPKSEAQLTNTAKLTVVRVGSFASGEHPTQGTVRLVNQGSKAFLEFDREFRTSSLGPDLVVVLHRSSDVLGATQPPAYPLKEGDYILLAPLKQFSGVQRYEIPATINISEYKSAAIWCRQFNATFGAAKLMSQ